MPDIAFKWYSKPVWTYSAVVVGTIDNHQRERLIGIKLYIAFVFISFYLYFDLHKAVDILFYCFGYFDLAMNSFIREFTVSDVDTLTARDIDECNECMRVKNGLNVFHTNIRSVAKNFDELQMCLEQFTGSFQIIVLTETFQVEDTKPYQLNGYDLVYNEGKVNLHDGVFVYVSRAIEYKYEIISLGEIRSIQLNLTFNNRKVCLTAVYRPNPTCPKLFNTHLHDYLGTIKGNIDYSVLIGDININIKSQKDYSQEYLNILNEKCYLSQINGFTRVDGVRKSCIDHVFFRNSSVYKTEIVPIILESKITDHYPIIVQFNGGADCCVRDPDPVVKTYINFKKLNDILHREQWPAVCEGTDVDDMTAGFTAVLENAVKNSTYTVYSHYKEK